MSFLENTSEQSFRGLGSMEEYMWEVTCQLFPEQALSSIQVISSPFRIPWVKSTIACGWNLRMEGW